MKVLITGANGFLGQHLVKALLEKDYTVIATSRGESRLPFNDHHRFKYFPVEITNDFELQAIMGKERPDAVVHAAAMTQPDECELQQEKCEEINLRGTATVLMNAEEFCRHFIFISTDFVFDGEKGNYKEDDHQNPVNWYGFTKVQAESIVESSEMPWAIIRTCLVYGELSEGARGNILTWVKENLEQQKPIKVVSDQLRTPTYIDDLVTGIELIIRKKAEGVFHLAGKDIKTPYEMAVETAEYLGLDRSLIEKVDASVFTQAAKRPLKTGLDTTKARKELGYEPAGFQEGVKKMFAN